MDSDGTQIKKSRRIESNMYTCRMSIILPWLPVRVFSYSCFFFFQAEDGIRDIGVTGVQTCALPILVLGALVTLAIVGLAGGGLALALFGPHLWLLLVLFAIFSWWRQSVVMVPDGCRAVITRFGKLEEVVDAGRKLLFNPWKQVSYIVNTTREYPYNAPIRQAPTASRVNASVDLFLQFKIEDPAEFIFTVGGVKSFSDKLENAISEVTRALIYEQRAEDIYDLVGESTQKFLDSLNRS